MIRKIWNHLSGMQMMAVGFLILILVGSLLLMLPHPGTAV